MPLEKFIVGAGGVAAVMSMVVMVAAGGGKVLLAALVLAGLAGLAGYLVYRLVCRLDPVWAAGGRVDVEGMLCVYRKRVPGRETLDRGVPLDRVAAVTWHVSAFDRSGQMYVKFWDRDPELTFEFFGLSPQDSSLRPLLKVSERVLRGSPKGTRRLQAFVEQREITCNIDLDTIKPIADRLPPLAPGIELQGRQIVRRPQT